MLFSSSFFLLISISTSFVIRSSHSGYSPLASNYSQCLLNLPYTSTCAEWRVASIILLEDAQGFSNKLQAIQQFLQGVTKSCTTSSHYQFFDAANDSSCQEYEVSSKSPSQLEKMIKSTEPVTNPAKTPAILASKMEALAACTNDNALKKPGEAGIVFIFIDIPCQPNFVNSNFSQQEQQLSKELFLEGFLVRIMYISDDRTDLNCYVRQFDECSHTLPICDIEIYSSSLSNASLATCIDKMQTCAANSQAKNGGDSSLSTVDIVLLVTIPVAVISAVACCCVWSFYRKTVRKMIFQAVLNHHSVKEAREEAEKKLSRRERLGSTENEERKLPDKDDDVWQICQEDLEIMEHELLGRGAFAKVVKGRLKGTIPLLVVNATINLVLENLKDGVCEVAVKRLPPHGDQQGVVDFLKEIKFMKQLGYHAHIISMVGCIISPVSPVILLEYCYHGDLLSFLRKNRPHVLMNDDEDCPIDAELCLRICDLISFAWQISDGVTYLHSKGWIHRDIAARNILITKSMVAKVSDFGLCRYADSALYVTKGGRLPVKWMAIESLKRFEFSMKSDAWSFGVLLHELFSLGNTPYPTVQPMELITYLDGGHRMDQPPICPNEVYALMLNCWDDEPSERPEFDQIGARLRQMLNIEDEYYGYVTLQNPKSVRYMLNREISQFPASEPKISVTVSSLNLTEDEGEDEESNRPGEFQRFPSTSDLEDFYSLRSRFSSSRTTRNTKRIEKVDSMDTIHEEHPPVQSNSDGERGEVDESWSTSSVVGGESPPKLEFSDILSTCQIYPSNHDRFANLTTDAEMADFYR